MKYYLILSRGFSKTLSRMRMIKQMGDDMSIKWGDSIREHETTTFEPVTQDADKYFKCSYCGCIVGTPYNFSVGIDYNFCPYCGRPVVESEDNAE